MARPALPKSFYTMQTFHTALLILYALSLFGLPSAASIVLLHSVVPLWIKLPLIMAFSTLASFGLSICLSLQRPRSQRRPPSSLLA